MYEITAYPRQERKKKVRKLRKEGKVPGVIYGHGEKTRLIYVEEEELKKLLSSIHSESSVVTVKLNGEELPSLIKEVQRDIFTGRVIHIDFHHLHRGEKVTVMVPFKLVGEAKGVKEGGILDFVKRDVEIECLPKDIPEFIEVDISNLGIGDSIHLRDLKLPEKWRITEDLEEVIVSIVAPKKLEEIEVVEEEEEVKEPEVVKEEEKKEEEEKEEEE